MNKELIQELCWHRDQILSHLEDIKSILQTAQNCDTEYHLANSHYIPQVITALKNDTQLLPRGEYSLQNTIDNLIDQLDIDTNQKGVQKYIF